MDTPLSLSLSCARRMTIPEVCSGCACWVEEGCLFCRHCGAARHSRRSSLTLSASLCMYSGRGKERGTALVESKARREGKASLRRRRQSSEDIHRQLQQWQKKSNTQESLLQDLQLCNRTTHQAAAAKVEAELRQIVHAGRALVKTWPLSSAPRKSSSTPPMTGEKRSASSAPAPGVARESSADVFLATLREHNKLYRPHQSACSPSNFPVVSNGSSSQTNPSFGGNTGSGVVTPEAKARGCVHHDLGNRKGEASGIAATQPSGWFWGAGGCSPGGGASSLVGDGSRVNGGVGIDVAAPGEGTMAAFWRERGKARRNGGAPVHDGTAMTNAAAVGATILPDEYKPFQQASVNGEGAAAEADSRGGDTSVKQTCNIHNSSRSRTFISVASAKAAVRSASNRATELSRLLSEGNNPPREECLAKAESAVRAAQSATSCANERLFQLELLAAAASDSSSATAEDSSQQSRGAVAKHSLENKLSGGDANKASGVSTSFEKHQHDSNSTASISCSSSSLSAHIEQLTEQLELAQTLQAASLTARARLTRCFALEDAAAIRMQALVRGCVARWRERRRNRGLKSKPAGMKKTRMPEGAMAIGDNDDGNTSTHAGVYSLSAQGSDDQALSSPRRRCSSAALSHDQGLRVRAEEGQLVYEEDGTQMLPRKEELWWTQAEAETADEVGEQESVILTAVVKLQAVVRSRLERSRTIAAVNARFVEYFDEEYQHPFYVCRETNCSQWTRPFGFGFDGRKKRDFPLSCVASDDGICNSSAGVGDGGEKDEHVGDSVGENVATDAEEAAVEQMPWHNVCKEQSTTAAVVIQCAWRAARARGLLSEKIIMASL